VRREHARHTAVVRLLARAHGGRGQPGGQAVDARRIVAAVGRRGERLGGAHAAGLLERLLGLVGLAGGIDLLQVQVAAVLLVWLQNLIVVLALHAVAYWIFPRLQTPISEPPPALRALVALDPL
jgi:hypothetical protein